MNNFSCRAAAPTGIAAANIEVEGTDVFATTIHNMFDLNPEYESTLDFTKDGTEKVRRLIDMQVLFLDEAGGLGEDRWE